LDRLVYSFEVKKGSSFLFFGSPKKPLSFIFVLEKKEKNRPAVGTGTNRRQVKKK
jgi:hypothetical protein